MSRSGKVGWIGAALLAVMLALPLHAAVPEQLSGTNTYKRMTPEERKKEKRKRRDKDVMTRREIMDSYVKRQKETENLMQYRKRDRVLERRRQKANPLPSVPDTAPPRLENPPGMGVGKRQ